MRGGYYDFKFCTSSIFIHMQQTMSVPIHGSNYYSIARDCSV